MHQFNMVGETKTLHYTVNTSQNKKSTTYWSTQLFSFSTLSDLSKVCTWHLRFSTRCIVSARLSSEYLDSCSSLQARHSNDQKRSEISNLRPQQCCHLKTTGTKLFRGFRSTFRKFHPKIPRSMDLDSVTSIHILDRIATRISEIGSGASLQSPRLRKMASKLEVHR